MNTQDELTSIRQRAEGVALWREHFMPPLSKIDFSQRDVPRLLVALDAVLGLHTEDLFRGHLSNGCRICGHDYPCATVRAVNDALEAGK